MIIKGASDIRGIRRLHTKPGSSKQSDALLELYQLATENDHLQKKLQWIRRQKDQTEKRLSEIAHAAHLIEKRRQKITTAAVQSEVHSTFLEY
jgi:hypothetical protein